MKLDEFGEAIMRITWFEFKSCKYHTKKLMAYIQGKLCAEVGNNPFWKP
jgi:hypothetical protein